MLCSQSNQTAQPKAENSAQTTFRLLSPISFCPLQLFNRLSNLLQVLPQRDDGQRRPGASVLKSVVIVTPAK
jgi:hypothetical protein